MLAISETITDSRSLDSIPVLGDHCQNTA